MGIEKLQYQTFTKTYLVSTPLTWTGIPVSSGIVGGRLSVCSVVRGERRGGR